ncbi:MAG: hypothetical protein KA473_16155 [Anaerolineales bacterium]|nr:hypothetical protein [Anaerolineales bacterium]MBP6210965.1 hypothetical protein [Anaerolineales bacterium]
MMIRGRSLFAKSILDFAEKPLWVFLFAFVVYFVLSVFGGSPFRVRDTAYFNYLADAFLHGQLHLRLLPASLHDLSFFGGKYYLYWPPMPAIFLMPLVAVFGVGVSDVFFNVVIAAANVAIFAALLRAVDRKGLIQLDAGFRALLSLFFAFGTVHLILALFGKLWFTAQLVGFFLVALAYLCAIELKDGKAFFIVGVLIASAMMTRNHLLFTGIWPAFHLISRYWRDRPKIYGYILLMLLPLITAGLLFLAYNFARFGSPIELGITYHKMDSFFVEDYKKYGAFNLYYVPINFYYEYIYYPIPAFFRFVQQQDLSVLMGGSLFLLSPVFFGALVGAYIERASLKIWVLVTSIIFTNIPVLLVMGTGWMQYGPRYTLDFTVPLLLLTAHGIRYLPKGLVKWLVAVSIVQYIPGIYLFVKLQI